MAPRNEVRIPNTADLAPFALCEFCKSMQMPGVGAFYSLLPLQMHWNGPQGQGPLSGYVSTRPDTGWDHVRLSWRRFYIGKYYAVTFYKYTTIEVLNVKVHVF
jgi:hypothetical protein